MHYSVVQFKLRESFVSLPAQIILHSMHKYQPRVHVIRKECGEELSPVRAVPAGEGTRTFSFPETVFTTVTAYQNQQVAQLTSTQPHFLLRPTPSTLHGQQIHTFAACKYSHCSLISSATRYRQQN